jgi:hypothetical protein
VLSLFFTLNASELDAVIIHILQGEITTSEVFREIKVLFSRIVLKVIRDTKAKEEEICRAVLDLALVLAAFASKNVLLAAKALNSKANKKILVANGFGILASYVKKKPF